MRILVVDDYLDSCVPLTKLIELMGHEASYALTGQEAIRLVAANPPDFILLDIMLPDITGIEVLSTIRKSGYAGVIAMLTAMSDLEHRNAAASAGANYYLVKSNVNIDTIQKLISQQT